MNLHEAVLTSKCDCCGTLHRLHSCCVDDLRDAIAKYDAEKKAAREKAERERLEKARLALVEHCRKNIMVRCPYCNAGFWQVDDTGFRKYHCNLTLTGDGDLAKNCDNTPRTDQAKWGTLVHPPGFSAFPEVRP